ncbi:hypothetical protein V8G54_000329 [Vigna mungo]|uniref:Uncharacterized protein n=1 Tax=Vigna mungo TaxID=3915 RepID=A0AAQ3P5D7_VIGMU
MGSYVECCMYEVRYPEVEVAVMIQVGRIEPIIVLRVDKEKCYIDIRERRVYEEDMQTCKERYNKSKLVHSIMCRIAEILNIDLEELYVHIGGHAFELSFSLSRTEVVVVLEHVSNLNEKSPLSNPNLKSPLSNAEKTFSIERTEALGSVFPNCGCAQQTLLEIPISETVGWFLLTGRDNVELRFPSGLGKY